MRIQIEIKAELLRLIVHALQASEGDLSKVSVELADIVNQIEK